MHSTPTDRRRGEATRAAIRAAGARLFAEHGFQDTSVRDIAREAGVDPALVIRHFRSKERLFIETMSVEDPARSIVEGPLEQLGEAMVAGTLARSDRAKKVYTALMRAADHEEVRDAIARANHATVIAPLARRLSGHDAQLRAALVSAQLNGLLNTLWMIEDEAVTRVPTEVLITEYGRALQVLIDG
ncbi:TetR family transcriptional regulator [Jatrophihabitans endophyticus]|uniref:TetR/AcrR family transcriptional regulator n=1 Tax=Jatrophihabitans endophyticus TaxID=1206085 RepID=UPI0019E9E610|nr:TetR family transcriptional regulator [Jatrophihabitans endophyticus]MBE7189815.1 TetR family transcriptional regulator [Jatrophihabitans endophyticus]